MPRPKQPRSESRSEQSRSERLETDPVIEAYKRDIDRTLLRENLKRSPEERLRELVRLQRFSTELAEAGRRAFGR